MKSLLRADGKQCGTLTLAELLPLLWLLITVTSSTPTPASHLLCSVDSRQRCDTASLHSASRDDLENGMAASGGDKVGQRCVGWDGKVRRRTNPRSGDARRGANTSLSTLPAVSGGNSTTVMGRWLRPRLSTPSPAVRRLRTQLELSWRWVETRKLRPLRSAIAKQERVRPAGAHSCGPGACQARRKEAGTASSQSGFSRDPANA